ncbi:MAG: hypothetical protein OXF65_01295 [Acidimicrobiaceae bacterium]|nr:hypothetical protein [Acidimicrobiaceae bacterium]
MRDGTTKWAQRLKQFVEYLQRERRVGPSAQHQYRSIVKDWIEFCLVRGHDPAVFDQTLVGSLLDHRAHRNNRGVLAAGSRLSYASNLRVFCEWVSAERPRTPSPAPRLPAVASSSAPPGWRQGAPGVPSSSPTPSTSQVWIESWQGPLPAPIDALEQLLRQGGTTIVRAAFQYSFFAHPDAVRRRTPWYPERARTSRKHYPSGKKGDAAQWQGRPVTLGDNAYAQHAWAKYTGRPIERGSGFSVRHIWGNPWDPDAFTAGWNLCYMPFWAGMLTEQQHPHPQLEAAVRQAAWNLYFQADPVCKPPEFVTNPGVDLGRLLGTQPIRVLRSDMG